MAYDDEGSFRDFRDIEDLAVILEQYLNAPENITVVRLLALTRAVHEFASQTMRGEVELGVLAKGLRDRGLSAVPFDTVVRVLDRVAGVARDEDVLAHVTLRDVQRIVAR